MPTQVSLAPPREVHGAEETEVLAGTGVHARKQEAGWQRTSKEGGWRQKRSSLRVEVVNWGQREAGAVGRRVRRDVESDVHMEPNVSGSRRESWCSPRSHPRNRALHPEPQAKGVRPGRGWSGLRGEGVIYHPDRWQFCFVICSDVNNAPPSPRGLPGSLEHQGLLLL